MPCPAPAPAPAHTPRTAATSVASGLRGRLVDQITKYLRDDPRRSPMIPTIPALVDAALHHGVDPRVMIAIAGHESEFGTTNPPSLRNNPFGFFWKDGVNSPFDSYEQGYERVARRLGEMINRQGFTSITLLGEGTSARDDGYSEVGASNDPTGINATWIPEVSAVLRELDGDPADIRLRQTA